MHEQRLNNIGWVKPIYWNIIRKSELDYYLEEATLDPNIYVRFNLFNYWKNNSPRFPSLAEMICDILGIPIITVASESTFSIGSRVLTKYRSSLLPKNVEALICTRNWMMGFPCHGNICPLISIFFILICFIWLCIILFFFVTDRVEEEEVIEVSITWWWIF